MINIIIFQSRYILVIVLMVLGSLIFDLRSINLSPHHPVRSAVPRPVPHFSAARPRDRWETGCRAPVEVSNI